MLEQIILHLIGDYGSQSDWQALNKTKRSWPCICHVVLYSLPFLLIGSIQAVLVIGITHFFIDRFGLARYLAYAKNFLCPIKEWPRWEECKATGYHESRPIYLAVWLLIALDNTLHLVINYSALRWL